MKIFKKLVCLSLAAVLIAGCGQISTDAGSVKKPSQVKITSAKNCDSVRKIRVKYKSAKNAKGYQVQVATSSDFKQGKKTTKVGKKTTVYVTGLKENTTYYARVRAFNKSGKKVKYGKWSAVKSAKTNCGHDNLQEIKEKKDVTVYEQVPFSETAYSQYLKDDETINYHMYWTDEETKNITDALIYFKCLCDKCQTDGAPIYTTRTDLANHMKEVNSPGWMEEKWSDHCISNAEDKDCWVDLGYMKFNARVLYNHDYTEEPIDAIGGDASSWHTELRYDKGTRIYHYSSSHTEKKNVTTGYKCKTCGETHTDKDDFWN